MKPDDKGGGGVAIHSRMTERRTSPKKGQWCLPLLPCGCDAAVTRHKKWYRRNEVVILKDRSRICRHGKRWALRWVELPKMDVRINRAARAAYIGKKRV